MGKIILLSLGLVTIYYSCKQKYNHYTTILWFLLMAYFLAVIQDQYIAAVVLLAGFYITDDRIKKYDPAKEELYKAINDLDEEFRSKKNNGGPSGGGMA